MQGGTALKQLPGNGRQSNSVCASDMGDCVERTGVRLARATMVSETVEGTGHCVEERLLVLVEHRYPHQLVKESRGKRSCLEGALDHP